MRIECNGVRGDDGRSPPGRGPGDRPAAAHPDPERSHLGFFHRRRPWRTHAGALGLIGLAVYQFSTGHALAGLHSLFLAIIALGLRGAIADLKP